MPPLLWPAMRPPSAAVAGRAETALGAPDNTKSHRIKTQVAASFFFCFLFCFVYFFRSTNSRAKIFVLCFRKFFVTGDHMIARHWWRGWFNDCAIAFLEFQRLNAIGHRFCENAVPSQGVLVPINSNRERERERKGDFRWWNAKWFNWAIEQRCCGGVA